MTVVVVRSLNGDDILGPVEMEHGCLDIQGPKGSKRANKNSMFLENGGLVGEILYFREI